MRNLILLRGASGAGKSTVAKLMKAVELFSTDDYFMVKGKYEFDPSKLEENHKKCLQDVENVIYSIEDIITDNYLTFDFTENEIKEIKHISRQLKK